MKRRRGDFSNNKNTTRRNTEKVKNQNQGDRGEATRTREERQKKALTKDRKESLESTEFEFCIDKQRLPFFSLFWFDQ